MRGIISAGAYVPYWRLQRKAIGEAMGGYGGSGTRAVASYDEDTTTMAVEAGRLAIRALGGPGSVPVDQLFLATSDPAYLEKTNATAVHAALRLDVDCLAAPDLVASYARAPVGTVQCGPVRYLRQGWEALVDGGAGLDDVSDEHPARTAPAA